MKIEKKDFLWKYLFFGIFTPQPRMNLCLIPWMVLCSTLLWPLFLCSFIIWRGVLFLRDKSRDLQIDWPLIVLAVFPAAFLVNGSFFLWLEFESTGPFIIGVAGSLSRLPFIDTVLGVVGVFGVIALCMLILGLVVTILLVVGYLVINPIKKSKIAQMCKLYLKAKKEKICPMIDIEV